MDILNNTGNIRLVNVKDDPKPSFDTYIGRRNKWLSLEESKWRNPFVLHREGDRQTILRMHKNYVLSRPDLIASLPELKDKTMACYCVPRSCHGHNLIDLYNELVRDDGTVDMEKYERMRPSFRPRFYWTGFVDVDADRINAPHIESEGPNEDRTAATMKILDELSGIMSFTLADALNIQNVLLKENNWKGVAPGLRNHEVKIRKPSGEMEITPAPENVPHLIGALFPITYGDEQQLLAWYQQVQTVHPLSDLNGRVFGIIVSLLYKAWQKRTELGF